MIAIKQVLEIALRSTAGEAGFAIRYWHLLLAICHRIECTYDLSKSTCLHYLTIMINPEIVGPVLFARGVLQGRCRLSALVISAPADQLKPLRPMGEEAVCPITLVATDEHVVWRYDFDLPEVPNAFYCFGEDRHAVATDLKADVSIAYVSCNGQEREEDNFALDDRNGMWRRLADEHDNAPFNLMLHGGDQLYADAVVQAHPTLTAWAEADPDEKVDFAFTDAERTAAERYLFRRYLFLYSQPQTARLLASVPSIMMWDDHDIFDGWGSLAAATLDSPVGQGLFRTAKRMFRLFQTGATDDHPACEIPPGAGDSMTHQVMFPDFDVIAPDLRSERRPDRVMGPGGWTALTRMVLEAEAPRRRILMSSVPLLGPRLSWVEALIGMVPKLRKYEDDLRDQWQSRAHRAEWRRCLTLLEEAAGADDRAITVVSGEIHLATRAEMPMVGGKLHQLVASGIAHPPPPQIYARALGWLAALGESPLPEKPITLKPLPGKKRIYVAERNYLVLERRGAKWSAAWELEESGRTASLEI